MLEGSIQTSGFRELSPDEVTAVSGGDGECIITTNIEYRYSSETHQNEEVRTFILLCQPDGSSRYSLDLTHSGTLEDWQSASNYDSNNQELIDFLIEIFDLYDGEGAPGSETDVLGGGS